VSNIRIGVRAHDMGQMDIESLKNAMDAYGFDGIQLVLKKALDETLETVDRERLKSAFDGKVMLLGAYFNMIHPDTNEVLKGVENFKKHLELARKLNISYVGTETGSLMGSPWGYDPLNHSDESFEKVVLVTEELIQKAKDENVFVAIEGAWNHTIYSPKRLKELTDRIQSPNLKVIVDLYNFLNFDNHQNHLEILRRSIELLKNKIVIFHLKDYIVESQKLKQVGLGKGLMQYKKIIPMILKEFTHVDLIFEGVEQQDLKSSLEFIKSIIEGEK